MERTKEEKMGSERGGRREDRGMKLEDLERRRREGEEWCNELVREGKKIDRRERWRSIIDSNYNKWYSDIKGEGIPRYLK